jgi:protein-tyrosine phosphatase
VVDFHNHLMPGVDDGASDDAEARAGLDALWAQGVRAVVATPHVTGSLTCNNQDLERRLIELEEGWRRLQAAAEDRYPELVLKRGAEVMLDTPELDLSEERLRLGGGTYVLVEYPFMMVPPQSPRVLDNIIAAGYVPIIAHPERYANVTTESVLPQEWRQHHALLQVNAGSITGRYGPQARANALSLLQRGFADFMCSDYHSRGVPATRSAYDALSELGAVEHADLLMKVNPGRMLNGEMPLAVPPLRIDRSLTERLLRWFR